MQTLSLCYVGGVTTEKENKNSPHACHIELADLCGKNQCHYHLYAMGYSQERFADYIECEKVNPYFHLHKPVPQKQLIEEISHFDYGVMPIKNSYCTIDDNGSYRKEKYIYAGTNKFFDYLQAGLPFIAAIPVVMMKEMIEKCDCALLWTIEEYDFEYLRANKERLKKNCLNNRHVYEIKNQIPRLLEFYESVRK